MKVVILAGGFGTRLLEHTTVVPKPMVEIGGIPIIEHIMNWYMKYNFNEFIICLGYKGHEIISYFKEYNLKTKFIITVLCLTSFLLILFNVQYLNTRYIKQIEHIFLGEQKTYSSNQVYFSLYKSGLNVFKDNIFFGVGNKNYRVETCKSSNRSNNFYKCTTHPHQIYIEFLSEHGLIGTVILLSIFFYLIFRILRIILKSKNLNTNVGDEGGFAPNVNSSAEVIEIILSAVEKAGLKINDDILLSLDVASTEFFIDNKYELKGEGKTLSSEEMVKYLEDLSNNFPIYSIEDGMSEDDWEGWIELTNKIGSKLQLVGDDLFVTNIKRLQTGIDKKAGNAILVKLNQIGTLSETIDAINLGKENNFSSIISHRSGETEDTTIADLSVAVSAGQIKTGSLSRTDRTAKYNQLLRIEEKLGSGAKYAGKSILKY